MSCYSITTIILISIIISCIKIITIKSNNNTIINTVIKNKFYKYIYKQYTVYGSEYQQAHQYFNQFKYNNHSLTYNEENALKSYYDCFRRDFSKIYYCLFYTNKEHGDLIDIDKHYPLYFLNNPVNRANDCSYNITLHRVDYSDVFINYHFSLNEYYCNSDYQIPGGTVFDVYAINSKQIVACKQHTAFNSTKYSIICSTINNITNISTKCLNLTVLLYGLHFDSYSEYAKNPFDAYYRIVIDNQQYCYDKAVESNNSDDMNITTSNNLYFYSGLWFTNKTKNLTAQNSFYSYDINEYHLTGYNYRKEQNKLESHTSRFGGLPVIDSKEYYTNIYKIYKVYQIRLNNVINLIYNPINYFKYKSVLTNQSNHYYFIGSSHMRYNFDAIIQFLYNDSVIDSLSRHHSEFDYNNLHSLSSFDLASSLYADDQADLLHNLCNRFESIKDNNKTNTIIFQTGDWDLSHMPLSRLFHEINAGQKLINIITAILTNELKCGNMNHFIWLTTVPITICYYDDESDCDGGRGHRNNAAISAMNEYYLRQLMNVNIKNTLRFSIVDAFSIIKPRLGLNFNSEVVCSFHYLCRINRDNQVKLSTIHTPGGDALIETILISILDFHHSLV